MKILKKEFIKNQRPSAIALEITAFIVFVLLLYSFIFWGRIYPGVHIAGISVAGLKPGEAASLLSRKIIKPKKMVLKGQGQTFEIDLETLDFSYDYPGSAYAAYSLVRTGNIFYDFYKRILSPFTKEDLGLRLKFDEEKLEETLSVLAGQVSTEPVFPSVKLVFGEIVVEKGAPGSELDIPDLRIQIGQSLAFAKNKPISIPLKAVDPSITDEEAQKLETRAQNLLEKGLSLDFEYKTYTLKGADILGLLAPNGEYNQEEIASLISKIAEDINREPQNATFVFNEGRVQEFTPAKDGVKVKEELLKEMIVGNLRTLETSNEKTISISIPIEATPPKIKTEEVNDLGIKELIGRGSSRFAGSIPSRIHNIAVASSKFNGVVIPPGEIFSFNDTLGDVSIYTGYKQAYVIRDGRTVLGDGGGVCQVSTTFFRAVLDAGLPIVERRAHSYRVGYYEQDSLPGFDATVYSPTTDLKFKNDTPGHILIQTSVDTKRASLVFEIYGTNDGRTVTITKPVVTNVVPPPEDLYQDDPSLPAGTIKQIDWKAWGAKVWFNYEVSRDGEIIYKKTFYSNYRPWQAVYLRGTGPIN